MPPPSVSGEESAVLQNSVGSVTSSTNSAPIATQAAKQAPTINIKVIGNILSIEGTMSNSDDTSSLVKTH